jgi:RHS repeat-associated protein
VAAITVSTGAVAYYHHDALGSTVAMTQAGTSGPAEVYTYDEFGNPAGGSFATYRYGGYRYDAETGLYYVRARYYSPQLGRFLQPDPIGYGGGRNLYAYVDNNPLNLTDPLGTCGNPSGCGFWNSLVNFAENHPVLAGLAAVGVVAAAVAAVAFAPEILGLFAAEEAVAATSVFWSGGAEAQAAAEAFALANNGVTIGMTEAGQELAALTEGMDWSAARPLWNALSAEFAGAAAGDITAFISSSASLSSIFFETELGILLENEAVTSLTLIFF